MNLLWILLIPLYCRNVSAGILGNVLSTIGDVSSKVMSAADSAIGGTLTTLQEISGNSVSLNEIKFFLFTNPIYDEPIIVDPSSPSSLAGDFEKIFFIIHGRQQNTNSPWMRNLSKILLKKYSGCKVVHVDWRGPASQEYPLAVVNSESVGNHVANLLKKITTEYNVPTRNIVLIGFSLGSHVCGFTGKHFTKQTGTKLPRIVALDPAGVLFVLRSQEKRLNPGDAKVVQVIHTDGGKIGLTQPCGTIDFYPNGGKDQPGCPHVEGLNIKSNGEKLRLLSLKNAGSLLFSANCDHERAYQYYLESVENYGSFAAKKCNNFEEVGKKNCTGRIVAMGDLDVSEDGVFYLETNSYAPFSKSSTAEFLISSVFGGQNLIDIRMI